MALSMPQRRNNRGARPVKPWPCPRCQSEQTHDTHCQNCDQPRFQWFEEQICRHILEHIEDGISEPLEMFTALKDRPCYASWPGSVAQVARYMRLLTKDTKLLAGQIADAHAARMMLDVVHHGDTKDKIAILKGRQVLGDTIKHDIQGTTVVKHVYETEPPKS